MMVVGEGYIMSKFGDIRLTRFGDMEIQSFGRIAPGTKILAILIFPVL